MAVTSEQSSWAVFVRFAHPAAIPMFLIFLFCVSGKDTQALKAVVGEEALSAEERRFLEFEQNFEKVSRPQPAARPRGRPPGAPTPAAANALRCSEPCMLIPRVRCDAFARRCSPAR